MGMIAAQRITSSLLAGSMTGAQLETLLGTGAGMAGWKVACSTKTMAEALAKDKTAFAAWKTSTKACDTAPFLNQVLADKLADDSTYMATAFNNATRAADWFDNPYTRKAIWSNDRALTALNGSATAVTAAKACKNYVSKEFYISGGSINRTLDAVLGDEDGKFILIGVACDSSGSPFEMAIYGRRQSSTVGQVTLTPVARSSGDTKNIISLQHPVSLYNSGTPGMWYYKLVYVVV